jgi:hypothetical protein
MTEAEVIQVMREHLEGHFPKTCFNCQRQFATLREYLQLTTHQGPPVPYDAMAGNWQPSKPIGTVTLANCPCGSTLVLSSHGMPLMQLWRLLNWARAETKRRGMSPQKLLDYLRDEICKQVLADGKPEAVETAAAGHEKPQ